MAELTVPIVVDWEKIKSYLDQHDFVEVVRCKDCRHLSENRIATDWHRICRLQGVGKRDDGFCDEAERKETEDENDNQI